MYQILWLHFNITVAWVFIYLTTAIGMQNHHQAGLHQDSDTDYQFKKNQDDSDVELSPNNLVHPLARMR